MKELAVAALMLIGGAFTLLSAVGMIRMPDLMMRLQVVTKAATLGAGGLAIAASISHGQLDVAIRAALLGAFLFVAVPTSSQFLARAALHRGEPFFEGTTFDDASRARLREEKRAPEEE